MTARQEITALIVCVVALALALFACAALAAHELNDAQADYVNERSVRVRIEAQCKSNPDGSAVCAPGTFADPRGTTTTTAGGAK